MIGQPNTLHRDQQGFHWNLKHCCFGCIEPLPTGRTTINFVFVWPKLIVGAWLAGGGGCCVPLFWIATLSKLSKHATVVFHVTYNLNFIESASLASLSSTSCAGLSGGHCSEGSLPVYFLFVYCVPMEDKQTHLPRQHLCWQNLVGCLCTLTS